MNDELTAALTAYEAAWNEPAPEARAAHLVSCVTDDIVLSPGYKPTSDDLVGLAAVSEEMGQMIASRPPGRGLRLSVGHAVDRHHGWLRFNWRVVDREGNPFEIDGMSIEGTDVAHLAADGRLDTVIVFMGRVPGAGPNA